MTKARSCPICKRPVPQAAPAQGHHPFCSKRCADIDLWRWLNGAYAIPSAVNDDSEREIPEAEEGGDFPPDPSLRH